MTRFDEHITCRLPQMGKVHRTFHAQSISNTSFLKTIFTEVELDINTEEVNEEAEDHESHHAIM